MAKAYCYKAKMAKLILMTVRVPKETRRLLKAQAAREERSLQFVMERELTKYARLSEMAAMPPSSEYREEV